MITYYNDRFLPKENVHISPDDRGFLFGDGVYEVVISYKGKLFRPKDHTDRLSRSLHELRISASLIVAEFQTICQKLIDENNLAGQTAIVYLQVTRGAALRKHTFPEGGVTPTVYGFAVPFEMPSQKRQQGIKVILAPEIRWARCDIKSIALLPNVLASQQAKEAGADETIFVHNKVLTEGSHTSLAAIFDGELRTHPNNNHILPGITRKVALELCGELGVPIREEAVSEKELKNADELMLLGTTKEIMPVVQVDNWKVKDGKPGPLTRKLQQAFALLRQ